jgi:protocatechuate 3,4-dioxygenase beta subunit
MRPVVLAAVVFAAATVSMRAQSPIIGRVVADDTGEPIRNARVVLNTPSLDSRRVVLTDAEGAFSLPTPPGRHSISATKTRFARRDVMAAANGQPVEIRLARAAAISGRILDAAGDPVIGARVTLETTTEAVVASTTTDDRGEYRLGSLPQGAFVLAVMTVGLPAPSFQAQRPGQFVMAPARHKTYYAGATTAAQAIALRINPGDERAGIDLVLPQAAAGFQPFDVIFSGIVVSRPPPPPAATGPTTGVIRGRVINRGGAVLPNAMVRFDREDYPFGPRIIRAGLDGRFEFRDLPAGTHRVSASKSRHFNASANVALKQGETRDDVEVALDAWGTMSGRVFDEHGEPVQGARVEVLQPRYEGGRRRLVPAAAFSRVTDDLGEYRLYGLAAGQYIVSADVGGIGAADLPGYARTYFPGSAAPAQAQFVSIGRFSDVSGIDFALERGRTARVAGRFLQANGDAGGGSLVLAPSARSASAVSAAAGARILPDGTFEFANVAPGDYVIQAYKGRLNSWTEGEFGAVRVAVGDADVTDLILRTSAGSFIRGRVSFDTHLGSTTPSASAIEITPTPVDADLSPPNNHATARIERDWTFAIEGINGPRRLNVPRLPEGWMLKEIRVGAIDVTDRPLPFGSAAQSLRNVDVVLTDRVNAVFGTLRDDRGRPVPGATIILFSIDRSQWYPQSRFVRRAGAGTDGAFSVPGIPFGTYHAAAIRQVPSDGADAWRDPAFLESLIPGALTVVAGDGQRTSVHPVVAAR